MKREKIETIEKINQALNREFPKIKVTLTNYDGRFLFIYFENQNEPCGVEKKRYRFNLKDDIASIPAVAEVIKSMKEFRRIRLTNMSFAYLGIYHSDGSKREVQYQD